MNKTIKQNLAKQLDQVQKLARVRTLTEAQALAIAGEIEKFLRRSPVAVTVRSNWDRVANSYEGTPQGTYVIGTRAEDGAITLEVRRDKHGFGARAFSISRPNGWKIVGHDAHPSSGATDDLATTKMVAM